MNKSKIEKRQAGTADDGSKNADVTTSSQTIAKPHVACCLKSHDLGHKNILSRELFIETIEAIKKQYEHDINCSQIISKVYSTGFEANLMYENHFLMNQLTKLLQVIFNDEHEYSMIEYFMWELDFGKKNKELSAYRKDKSKIDLSNAGKLYDYLIENITING